MSQYIYKRTKTDNVEIDNSSVFLSVLWILSIVTYNCDVLFDFLMT